METISAVLRNLTLNDVGEWAGAKILSRGRSYLRHVKGLSRLEGGTLAAWVTGSQEYATSVRLTADGQFDYSCTCPYDWGPCKHAVAVVLSAAEQVKQKKDIPLLKENSDLYDALYDDSGEYAEDEDDYPDDEEEPDEDDEPEIVPKPLNGGRPANSRLEKILQKMEKDHLITMILELTARYPEIERGMLEQDDLARGRFDTVVSSLRREIRTLTAEPAWYNSWKGEGNLPDYSHVETQLRALLDGGHADAVIQLGEELWDRGNEQVGQSHDEGDTAYEIAECLEIVVQAVPRSAMTPAEQLLWVIDRTLDDEYSLLDSGGKLLESDRYTRVHWSAVAETLAARLKAMATPASASFSDTYRRNKLLNMLVTAYNRSGAPEKVIPLLEREADACRCYEKLVATLVAAGEKEKGRQWCIRGFERTVEHAPGTAAALKSRLRQMAEEEQRYDLAAAYRVEDFLERASRTTFTELRTAAEKAGAWPAVRTCILRYLETGQRPDAAAASTATAWPLPRPEVTRPLTRAGGRFPDREMLIDIAILEERFDDVVALYRQLRGSSRWAGGIEKSVADAVAASHPQVALDIWRSIVDNLISQVKPKAYEEAAGYLRCMARVYEENRRLPEWQGLLGDLRREHKAKRRLLEVLDGLSGRKLTD